MEKQKIGVSAWAVLAVLLIGGMVTAYVADASGKTAKEGKGYKMGMREGWDRMHNMQNQSVPGMPGNESRCMMGERGVLERMPPMQNLSNPNLPENATKEEIREAIREKTAEQLGLPENATDAEIRDAMQKKADETQNQIDAAIASGNYDAWKTLAEQNPGGAQITAIITEDKFPKYVELYQAEKKVKTLGEELGLPGMKMNGCELGHGTIGKNVTRSKNQ
jgi:hypothetical protein